MKKIIIAAAGVAVLLGGCAVEGTTSDTAPAESPAVTAPAAEAPAEEAQPGAVSQTQASLMAESYLVTQAFSPSGLITQLEFEGFSNAEATAAVQGLSVDWQEQANRMAASYLDGQAFSRQGLIDQLVFEGFTAEQAAIAAASVGL
jgi:hypothetical protein